MLSTPPSGSQSISLREGNGESRPFTAVILHAGDDPFEAEIRLTGDVCYVTTPEARTTIDAVLKDGATVVRIDLRDVDCFSAAAISAVVELARTLSLIEGTVELVAPQAGVRRVLEACGLEHLIAG